MHTYRHKNSHCDFLVFFFANIFWCVHNQLLCFLSQVDKFCPESCCVVGNYYSLKGKHENAVTYFQRAIKLNSKYDFVVSFVLNQTYFLFYLILFGSLLFFLLHVLLDSYLSAWTLMGHEYMELRNTAAAVQCYRNAVGISEVEK